MPSLALAFAIAQAQLAWPAPPAPPAPLRTIRKTFALKLYPAQHEGKKTK